VASNALAGAAPHDDPSLAQSRRRLRVRRTDSIDRGERAGSRDQHTRFIVMGARPVGVRARTRRRFCCADGGSGGTLTRRSACLRATRSIFRRLNRVRASRRGHICSLWTDGASRGPKLARARSRSPPRLLFLGLRIVSCRQSAAPDRLAHFLDQSTRFSYSRRCPLAPYSRGSLSRSCNANSGIGIR